jgi:ribonucleoside-diphosphate reductase alpha chain
MRKHRDSMRDVNSRNVPSDLYAAAKTAWDDAVELASSSATAARATVLAPTGTIGFMMDCDTTEGRAGHRAGQIKKLVGGGMVKIVNQTVPMALAKLGYS